MAPQKSPAFQFYPKDFMAGTATMSLQEVGAYMRLLCYAWDAGSVPTDPKERSRICACSRAQERELWKKVGTKFSLQNDVYLNERMEEERQKQADYRRRQSDKGKASATVRWQPDGNRAVTTVTPRLQPDGNSSSSSSSSSSSKEQIPASKERSLPVGFAEWWSAYPKKVSKGAALKAWTKLKPDQVVLAQMLDALRWQVRQPSWTKDGGAFIPHPATWLGQGRWQDEVSTPVTFPTKAAPAVPAAVDEAIRTRQRRAEMAERGMSPDEIEAVFEREYLERKGLAS